MPAKVAAQQASTRVKGVQRLKPRNEVYTSTALDAARRCNSCRSTKSREYGCKGLWRQIVARDVRRTCVCSVKQRGLDRRANRTAPRFRRAPSVSSDQLRLSDTDSMADTDLASYPAAPESGHSVSVAPLACRDHQHTRAAPAPPAHQAAPAAASAHATHPVPPAAHPGPAEGRGTPFRGHGT